MKTSRSIPHRNRGGYILLMTLTFLASVLMMFGSVLWWAVSTSTATQKNEQFTTAEEAADGATELVVGTLERDWTYGESLSAPSVYQGLVPATKDFPNIQFGNGSGVGNQTGYSLGVESYTNTIGSQYPDLAGYYQTVTITSTATTSNQLYNIPATVQQKVYAATIPLFQFAVFYNLNLDISPGQPMNINGPVFCNGTIWMWPYAAMNFSSTVSAAGWVTNKMEPYDQQSSSGHVTPTYTLQGEPVSKADSLTMPIGTTNTPAAVEAIINLPPTSIGAPNSAAYTTNGQVYLFNEVDLIVSNAANGFPNTDGTNITVWFQDPQKATPLTQVQPNVTNITAGVTNKSFSWVTNAVSWDFRESETNEDVQLNVGALNTWLTNTSGTGGQQYNKFAFADEGHGIRSVFIYNKVPKTATQLPSVRVVNAAQLPYTTDPGGSGRTTDGLTIVTPQPLYTEGNFNVQTASSATNASAGTTNTTYTYPGALMADAVTVLSSAWNDSNTAYQDNGNNLSGRNPVNTTVNAACLEGIVQSTNSGGNNYYSGGLENFIRLEENWGNTTTLTYNGSIVVMFPSIYATNFWQVPGNYYNPPTRQWGFDVNFTNPSKMPEPTPEFFRIIRESWTAY